MKADEIYLSVIYEFEESKFPSSVFGILWVYQVDRMELEEHACIGLILFGLDSTKATCMLCTQNHVYMWAVQIHNRK